MYYRDWIYDIRDYKLNSSKHHINAGKQTKSLAKQLVQNLLSNALYKSNVDEYGVCK